MIDFNNIYKSYPSQDILINATFRINFGERVGIVGPNGAGKSTLFSLITEELQPDKGNVNIPLNSRIGYLRQNLSSHETDENLLDFASNAIPELGKLHDEIELLEQQIGNNGQGKSLKKMGELQSRFEALGGYDIRTRSEAILSGLGFRETDFNNPLKTFSGGWQMRAGLAKVLVSEPEIMLLDEPSNYLDIPAIEWLQRYLKNFKGTLALISHDRYLLKSLTDVTLEINGGIVTRYPGNYDFYEKEREHRFKTLSAAKKNQDKKRQQLERFVEKFKAKNTKASQAQSKLKMLEKMEDIRLPDSLSYTGTITIPPPPHSGAEMMRLENVSFSYQQGDFQLNNLNLRIEKGTKIALTGYNGTGKTTLLKLIAGTIELKSGRRVPGHKVVIGYQAQEFGEILPSGQSVFDIVRNAAPEGVDTKNIRAVLGTFGFSGETIDKQCKVLSGGEKIRLCFARIFINPPNFLILDEPTTHLDLNTREALQKALKKYSGTLCLVSHDIEFVRNTAEMIIEMIPSGIKRYHGNYNYFLEKKEDFEKNAVTSSRKKVSKDAKKAGRQERATKRNQINRETHQYKKKIEKIECHIEKLEEEKVSIISKIESNDHKIDFYTVNKRLVEIEDKVSDLTEKWEAATLTLEEILIKYNR